jgi:hypothetical protein
VHVQYDSALTYNETKQHRLQKGSYGSSTKRAFSLPSLTVAHHYAPSMLRYNCSSKQMILSLQHRRYYPSERISQERGTCQAAELRSQFPCSCIQAKKPYVYEGTWVKPIAESSIAIRLNQSRVRDMKDSCTNSPLRQILRQRHQQQSMQTCSD